MPARSTGGDALSRTLRELRVAAGLSQVETAKRVGCSQALVARFETGRQIPTAAQVERLSDVYSADGVTRRQVVEMATDARARTERVVMRRADQPAQKRINRIAETARQEDTFSPALVPNLLQTAAYSKAMMYADPNLTDEQAEANATEQLRGQDLLDSDREYGFLLPEGALGWALLDSRDMTTQVEHLIASMDRPSVTLGIIPWGRPAAALPMNSFAMFDDRLVVVGTTTRVAYLTARPELDAYRTLYDHLATYAAFGDEARAILEKVATRYRGVR